MFWSKDGLHMMFIVVVYKTQINLLYTQYGI